MSEDNKALVRRFYEETHDRANFAALDDFIATNFVDHTPFLPGLAPGIEGVKQVFTMFLGAFSDIHVTVEDQIAEGDKVVSRGTARMTHTGDLMGIAPTGKQVELKFIEIFRVVGGKLAEHWEIFDQLGMMQQLGAIPPMS